MNSLEKRLIKVNDYIYPNQHMHRSQNKGRINRKNTLSTLFDFLMIPVYHHADEKCYPAVHYSTHYSSVGVIH